MNDSSIELLVKYVSCSSFVNCTHLPDDGFAMMAIPCDNGFWQLVFNNEETKKLVLGSIEPIRVEHFNNRHCAIIKAANGKFGNTQSLLDKLKQNTRLKIVESNGGTLLPWKND